MKRKFQKEVVVVVADEKETLYAATLRYEGRGKTSVEQSINPVVNTLELSAMFAEIAQLCSEAYYTAKVHRLSEEQRKAMEVLATLSDEHPEYPF